MCKACGDNLRHLEPLPVPDFEEESNMAGRKRRGAPIDPANPPEWYRPPRPPFEKGNVHGARSGVWSERLVAEDTERIMAKLKEDIPWLAERHGIVLDVLVKAKVRYDRIDAYIDRLMFEEITNKSGDTGIEAIPERLLRFLSSAERTIIDACGKLGLTATDEAVLMKDVSWAKALQRGRAEELAAKGAQLRALRKAE